MNKKEVQSRVLRNGKPLALSKFTWCEKTSTFSSDEDCLVIDFSYLKVTVTTGSNSTVKTGWDGTVTTGSYSTVTTSGHSTVTTGSNSTITTGSNGTVTTGSHSTVTTSGRGTVTTGWASTITTGSNSTVTTGWDSAVSSITNGKMNVIISKEGQAIQTPPHLTIDGFIVDGMYNGDPYIIADGILSEVINKKGDVYKVINHGENRQSYIVKNGDVYSHGKTIKQAREDLIYKLSDRDTSKYDDITMDTVLTKEECIQMYMVITGACSSGMKYFVNNQTDVKDEYTVAEIVKLTQGQWNHNELVEFMDGK
jgi:hypothetical protein